MAQLLGDKDADSMCKKSLQNAKKDLTKGAICHIFRV
jgi:hypothetical protein